MGDTIRETIAAVYAEQNAQGVGASDAGSGGGAAAGDAGGSDSALAAKPVADHDTGGSPGAEAGTGRAADRPRDESGKFAKADKAAKPVASTSTAEAPKAATAPPADVAPATVEPTKPATTTEKAPQALKAMTREKWASLPEDVREDFARRERDHKKLLDEAAEHRKSAQTWRGAVEAYEPMLKAQGLDPVKATEGLLQLWSTLHSAPGPQKAGIIASLMQRFGVAPETVGQALQAPQQPQFQAQRQAQPDVAQLVEQALAKKLEEVESRKVEQELADFESSHEFYADVREDMGLMAQALEARGLAVNLENLYTRSIALHPEISGILKQREAAKNAATAQATTQRAQAAASSVRSSPAAPPSGAQSGNLKSTISQIYREQMNR